MLKIRTNKVVFFMTNMSIQPFWLTHLLKFYWFLNSNSQEFIVGSFSYKAHFRPQISSNDLETRNEKHLAKNLNTETTRSISMQN